MAITILRPAPVAVPYREENSSNDSDDGGVDLEGDIDMPPAKRARHQKDIVTPGETVTDDPQWMRCVPFDIIILSFFFKYN
jgi:exosome complex component RRP4